MCWYYVYILYIICILFSKSHSVGILWLAIAFALLICHHHRQTVQCTSQFFVTIIDYLKLGNFMKKKGWFCSWFQRHALALAWLWGRCHGWWYHSGSSACRNERRHLQTGSSEWGEVQFVFVTTGSQELTQGSLRTALILSKDKVPRDLTAPHWLSLSHWGPSEDKLQQIVNNGIV